MATSAEISVVLTAERVWWKHRAHKDFGIGLSAGGHVLVVGPLANFEDKPKISFSQRLLLPGRVDPFAPGTYLTPEDLSGSFVPASPGGVYARLRARLLARAKEGITCVGVPHGPVRDQQRAVGTSPFALADLIVAAAMDVGLRVAVLDDVTRASSKSALGIESVTHDFHALVSHLISYADARLSWALLVSEPEALLSDGLVGLKVRMGHLPLIIVAPKHNADDTVVRWMNAGILDAATSIVFRHPPKDTTWGHLRRHGSLGILADHPLDGGMGVAAPAPCRGEAGGAVAWGDPEFLALASGFEPQVTKLNDFLATAPRNQALTLMQAAARGGAATLSLRCPGWSLGRWADFYTLPWPYGTATEKDDLRCVEDVLVMAARSGSAAVDVMVGGRLIVRDGQHPLD